MFSNPSEKTLIISDKPCKEFYTQKGGDPIKIITNVNNANNKYIFFENCEEEFTFDNSLNSKNDIQGSTYVGRGSFTAVFAIKDKNDKIFILRIEEEKTMADLTTFINQWKEDKKMFPKNIIDIHAYGMATVNGVIVGTYTITNMYNDSDKILKLNLYQKNKFMFNMLSFLVELQKNDIYYRDFKLPNIGFDNDIDLNFIVLDYDNMTIIKRNNEMFKQKCIGVYNIPNSTKAQTDNNNFGVNICYGTFLPLIAKTDYPKEYNDPTYTKYYCIALSHIIFVMYHTFNSDLSLIFKELLEQSKTFDSIKSTILNNIQKSKQKKIIGGNSSLREYIQASYLTDFEHKYDKLQVNFEKNECNVYNMYHTYNFYDELKTFNKSTILNMVNPNSHLIMTEQQILDSFKSVFLKTFF